MSIYHCIVLNGLKVAKFLKVKNKRKINALTKYRNPSHRRTHPAAIGVDSSAKVTIFYYTTKYNKEKIVSVWKNNENCCQRMARIKRIFF